MVANYPKPNKIGKNVSSPTVFELEFSNCASMFINMVSNQPLHKILIKKFFFEIQRSEISERYISKNTFLIKILCKGYLDTIFKNMIAQFEKSS